MEQLLVERLSAGAPLLADGATGTMLMAAGLPAGTPPELWNVEQPEKILALHRAYLSAGSQVILTNTFGGTPTKLGKAGLAARAHELNLAAARLARQAAGSMAFVAGDLGPTGELMKPFGSLTFDQALQDYAEQAAALAEGGVDLLWVETMTDLQEAKAAVMGARQASNLPVFCSMSFGRKARTIMGVSAKQAAQELWPLGLAAIGANCGDGLEMIPEVLRQMREVLPDAPLIVKPNAGLPRMVSGETLYDVGPADFCGRMNEFVAQGARVIGSCCGSGPEYIAALAAATQG
jgi:5-methyltetrahydrofolate--homocysteine methyltransferase